MSVYAISPSQVAQLLLTWTLSEIHSYLIRRPLVLIPSPHSQLKESLAKCFRGKLIIFFVFPSSLTTPRERVTQHAHHNYAKLPSCQNMYFLVPNLISVSHGHQLSTKLRLFSNPLLFLELFIQSSCHTFLLKLRAPFQTRTSSDVEKNKIQRWLIVSASAEHSEWPLLERTAITTKLSPALLFSISAIPPYSTHHGFFQ